MRKKSGTAEHRVTQHDIAQRLGIHQMTVSRVLSGSARVSPETRDKILALAGELGYRPNIAALRVRSGGRYFTVHYACSNTPGYNSNFWPVLSSAARRLSVEGYQLGLTTIDFQKLSDDTFTAELLRKIMADGLLIGYVGNDVPPQALELIRRHHLPVIWVNSRKNADCLYFDDFNGALDCVRFLIGRGHRRIAYINTSENLALASAYFHYSNQDRHAGYSQAMQEARLPELRYSMPLESPHPENCVQYLRQRLAQDHITAALCYNEEMLETTLFACEGLPEGRKIELAGFGYSTLRHLGRELIQVQLPLEQLGEEAANMLLYKIQHPQEILPAVALPLTIHAPAHPA